MVATMPSLNGEVGAYNPIGDGNPANSNHEYLNYAIQIHRADIDHIGFGLRVGFALNFIQSCFIELAVSKICECKRLVYLYRSSTHAVHRLLP